MPVTTKKFWYVFDVQRLNFGSYVASDFNLGWTHGSNMPLSGFPSSAYSSSTYKQRYSFSMKPEQGPDWKCECGAKAAEKSIESKVFGGNLSIPLMQRVTLSCSMQDSQKGSPWTLEMSDGDQVVGAVGTVNKEQVWLSPDAGPELRPQLATVATALLVYRDMLAELENGKETK